MLSWLDGAGIPTARLMSRSGAGDSGAGAPAGKLRGSPCQEAAWQSVSGKSIWIRTESSLQGEELRRAVSKYVGAGEREGLVAYERQGESDQMGSRCGQQGGQKSGTHVGRRAQCPAERLSRE